MKIIIITLLVIIATSLFYINNNLEIANLSAEEKQAIYQEDLKKEIAKKESESRHKAVQELSWSDVPKEDVGIWLTPYIKFGGAVLSVFTLIILLARGFIAARNGDLA